ncbi:NYN domain-containing protein [Curvibacter sp. HBC28]|uniref:NYN domain-containing protein n=1 Tax=Curvibacter microcysteis TaxID=3026419 RepID=A0ABT5MB76_9BURK|nr:NYN domain-containing protein [Curvibacter sp. HBC28]
MAECHSLVSGRVVCVTRITPVVAMPPSAGRSGALLGGGRAIQSDERKKTPMTIGYTFWHIRPLAVRPPAHPGSVPTPWGFFIFDPCPVGGRMNSRPIAILIDGSFLLKRLPRLLPADQIDTPEKMARCVRKLCFTHVMRLRGGSGKLWQQHLYRAFFYDAIPFDGKAHHPIDNQSIDFAKSAVARQRHALFEQLRKERKLALRLGKVNRDHDWTLSPRLTKEALRTRDWLAPLHPLAALIEAQADPGQDLTLSLSVEQARQLQKACAFWQGLQVGDVALGLRQKGVDMRIAIDIASLTLKKQAGTIVLVAGDSDFVPAAKLARREGMEFILDPLWQSINDDLFEHIDALQSGLKPPNATPAS